MEKANKLKQEIASVWDYGAADYDKQYSHGLHSSTEKKAWLQALQEIVGPGPTKALQIIDVGTGTGFLALLLAELGHQVRGFDISAQMLNEARQKAEKQGLATVRFEMGDAEKLPLPDKEADLLISRHLLWTLPHPEIALKEWQRVVKPGGKVAIIDGLWGIEPDFWQKVKKRAGQVLIKFIERNKQIREHHYSAEAMSQLPLNRFRSHEQIRALLIETGFTDVSLHNLEQVDKVERATMPFQQRLTKNYRHYLLIASVS